MPRYKVKAHDGKTLTIDAQDESALDEAMSDYESQSQSVPEQAAPLQTKEEGISTGRALAENVPFGPTMLRKADTGSFYGKGIDAVAQGAGDIGAGAGLVGAGLALGAAPVALGLGAGALAGAGLEKSGISPWLREKGQKFRDAGQVPQDQSVFKNFMSMLPREIGATSIEMIPSLSAGILGGLGLKGAGKIASRAQGLDAAPMPKQPSPQIIKAQELQKAGYGDILTKSHLDPNDTSLRGMMDLEPGPAKEYTQRLKGAITKDFEKSVKPPSLTLGEEATGTLGKSYGKTFEGAMEARSKAYTDMMSRADSYIGPQITRIGGHAHAGKSFFKDFSEYLDSEGVNSKAIFKKIREGGKITEKDIPLRSNLDAETVSAGATMAEDARLRAPSPIDLDGAINKYTRMQGLFEGRPDAAARFGKTVRGLGIKSVDRIIEAVDKMNAKQGHKPFKPDFDAQKANWAQGADVVDQYGSNYKARTDKLGQPIKTGMTSPEKIFEKDILTGGSQNIANLRKFLEDNGQSTAIIEEMGKDYLASRAMGVDGFDVNKLETNYRKFTPEQRVQIFKPETQKIIEQMIERGKQAAGPTGPEWGIPTNGGSPTAPKLGFMNKLKDPLKARATGATIGTAAGGAIGGLPGMAVGALIGERAGDFLQGRAARGQFKTAKAFMAPDPKLIENALAGNNPSAAAKVIGALARKYPGLDIRKMALTGSLGANPSQQAPQ